VNRHACDLRGAPTACEKAGLVGLLTVLIGCVIWGYRAPLAWLLLFAFAVEVVGFDGAHMLLGAKQRSARIRSWFPSQAHSCLAANEHQRVGGCMCLSENVIDQHACPQHSQ